MCGPARGIMMGMVKRKEAAVAGDGKLSERTGDCIISYNQFSGLFSLSQN